MIRAVIFGVLLVAVPPVSSGQSAREPQKAPALALKDLRGRTLRLGDYRGKVVLLNFWATWCPPCRAEIPDLVKYQREYGSRGLQIVGVTYPPERRARVRAFARRMKVNYPVALGTRAAKALFTSDETLPLTVVIDRDGAVRDIIGGILLPEEFDEKVKPLLQQTNQKETEHVQKSEDLRDYLRAGVGARSGLGLGRD